MAGRLTTIAPAVLTEHLHDITVADFGTQEINSLILKPKLKTQIAHQRTNHSTLQAALRAGMTGNNEQQLIAINQLTGVVDHHDAVTITIKGNAQIRFFSQHALTQRFGLGRADTVINVKTIRLRTHGNNRSAQLAEHGGSNLVGGSMSAIQHNFQPAQVQRIRRAFAEFDITASGVINTLCFAQ